MRILNHFKKKSVKRFSLFFMIAFVFLIFSKLSNSYKQTIPLKINLVDIDDEILLKNDSLNYINAYVEAKGFSLISLMFTTSKDLILSAKLDVSITSHHFIFDVQKQQYLIEDQLGDSYKLLNTSPDTLLIAYSKSASKMVPIELKQTIDYAIGYDLKGNFKLSQDSVKIVGPASEIYKINTIATKEVVLNDVQAQIDESVDLDISEYADIAIFPKKISMKGDVVKFTEGTVEVPISIKNQPSDVTINYFPKTVNVSYYVDLENYNTIKALDFKVECDYDTLKENQTYLVPKVVKKPEVVKYTNVKQKKIDFIKL
ncbi:MAG: CdaR family protein [Winogradskyella sp.]|uniref:CdaR family protein n=1 Tax=Winogradskyella sp. TaxID=1883156 RepID=UPI0038582991